MQKQNFFDDAHQIVVAPRRTGKHTLGLDNLKRDSLRRIDHEKSGLRFIRSDSYEWKLMPSRDRFSPVVRLYWRPRLRCWEVLFDRPPQGVSFFDNRRFFAEKKKIVTVGRFRNLFGVWFWLNSQVRDPAPGFYDFTKVSAP